MKTICLLALLLGAMSPGQAQTRLTPRQEAILAAATNGSAPCFNGPRVIGIHPNTPLNFRLAVSAARPLEFSASGLPAGLELDPRTGILTGTLQKQGKFAFTAKVANAAGKASAKFTVVVGDQLALTPPMGWNSYDAFGDNVLESEVRSNAVYLAEHMQPFGWDTVVVDYRWYDPGAHNNDPNGRANAPLVLDSFGRLLPAPNRFPSAAGGAGFKPLADEMHAQGLKFGIHMMRGIPRNAVQSTLPVAGANFTASDAADTNDTCSWCPDMFGVRSNAAGQAWYDSCARLWAAWGVDYIKVDDLSSAYRAGEIEMIRRALDRSGRSIVFSTSPGETPVAEAAHIMTHANLWRVSEDFWDNWKSLKNEFGLAARWQPYVGPGHWPDADMLAVGHLSMQHRSVGIDRFSGFTRDEELTLLSFWSLLPSPLMVGANLPDNDAWTLALLTNPEALAVNQDSPVGSARQMMITNGVEVWVKLLNDGTHAVGIFNRGQLADFDESAALYKSPLITRRTPGNSVDIDLNVAGAKKLWLVVYDGGDGTGYDHADWLNPQLSSPSGETSLTRLKWVTARAEGDAVYLNRSVAGGPLDVAGVDYLDGIGTHANSVIEYDLPPGCTRFKTRAGVDHSGVTPSNIGGTVHFMVFTNNPLFTSAVVNFQLDLKQLGLSGRHRVRDLWLRQDLGRMKELSAEIPPHGCMFLKVN